MTVPDPDAADVSASRRETWAHDAVLTDGGTVHIRPAHADDAAALGDLYERLSDDSLYMRFFSPVPRARAVAFERLDQVDEKTHMALVVEQSDELIAIARYDRADERTAEVAFTVRDDQQGRGVGMLLLEYLAVVARSNGIERFVADTLPTNRKMLDVFRGVGWDVKPTFADGTMHVEFSIAPSAHALAAIERREHVSEANSIARILAPSSIAVVGASREPGTVGHEVFRNLLEYDFDGPVYPVHKDASFVAGVHAYHSILDVPDDVDLAIIAVPAAAVPGVIDQCATKGVHGAVILSAGFAETGEAGRILQQETLVAARRNGLRLIGPNCMGVINTSRDVRMQATFAQLEPRRGGIAFGSQSGGLGIELVKRATRLGLGISSFVSLGNKADVSSNDLIQFWEGDDATDVILLYLESFGNPAKFARLARRIGRKKPIIAVKSGRTTAGVRAASSHTAALAAPDLAVDALFRQAGVVRVDTLEELFDVASVLAHQPLPAGRRVAIVGNSGGPNILAADACAGAGLVVPELAEATQAALGASLPAGAALRNPVDLVASATEEHYRHAVETVLADDAIDAVLIVFVPPLRTETPEIEQAVRAAVPADCAKPVVACFLGSEGIAEPSDDTEGGSAHRPIPSFEFPEAAIRALAHAADLADWRRRDPGVVPDIGPIDQLAVRNVVATALARDGGGGWLTPDETQRLLRAYRIPTVTTCFARDADEAAAAAQTLGFPVALKVASPRIVHKSDVGGVALDVANPDGVRTAYAEMQARLGNAMDGAIVQPMVDGGVETIAGIVHDRQFGPLVMFGLGGVTAELLADRSLQILPVTDVDAAELVRSLRGTPLLTGYRGSAPVDLAALEDLIVRLGILADTVPEIAELDLNPVIATPRGASVLDAKVRVQHHEPPTPAGLRHMRF